MPEATLHQNRSMDALGYYARGKTIVTIDGNTIAILAGFAATFIMRIFDIADRRLKAAELRSETARTAEELKYRTEENAADLKAHAAEQSEKISAAVSENTELTKEGIQASQAAQKEANDINQKIERLARSNQGILAHIDATKEKTK